VNYLTVVAGALLKNENEEREIEMRATERAPRWETFTTPLAKALDFAFGCRHKHMSRVFTIGGRTYKVCCDCGTDFDYSLKTMEIEHHRVARATLKLLRTRHT
jgi:hypothetical protein